MEDIKILYVDDDINMLNTGEEILVNAGFKVSLAKSGKQAVKLLEKGMNYDLILLDIDMPDMNGLMLAAKIKEASPQTSIIFLTGYSEYAVKAFELHAQGYLMKPVNEEKLKQEVSYALSSRDAEAGEKEDHIFMRTFGSFDVFVDGEPVHFSRARSKELLAFLVDRQGALVSRAEAFAAMYEDDDYTRDKQKQFDVIVRSLKTSLKEAGISEVFDVQRGSMRVVNEEFSCDLYDFLAGDTAVINSFRGEYMSSYEWAMFTEGILSRGMYE